jgi:GNAT superfamily N-acetyltransferase
VTDDQIHVEPLDRRKHQVQGFDCGDGRLNRWLHASAGQAQHRDAPDRVRKGVPPHFPIPVALVARLAVATSHQGQGLGSDLLRDSLRRILAASDHVGIRAVLVHAIDEGAADFYRRLGFEAATPDGLTLMVPLTAVRAALTGG